MKLSDEVETQETDTEDALLDCLYYMTQYYHKPYSRAALRAGMPLRGGAFTPQIFLRAAKRAGFTGRVVSRPLKKIPSLVLPVILLLKDKKACILHEISDKLVKISLPEQGGGLITKTFDELESLYTDHAIYLQPTFQPESADEQQHTHHPKDWFWGTLKHFKRNYIEVAFAALFINIFSLVSPLFVMNVYDRVVPNSAMVTLWVLAIGVFIIFVFDTLLRILRGYLIDVCSKKADTLMAGYLYDHIMDLQLINKPRSIGAFVNNLREFESVRDFFTSATFVTLIDFPFLILFLVLIWSIGGPLVIVPLLAIPIILIVTMLIERPLRAIVHESLQGQAQKNAILVESLTGLETIKTLVAEGALMQKWEQQVAHTNRLTLKSRFLSSLMSNFSYFMQQASYVGTIIVGVYLIDAHQLSMGGLIACSILAGRALTPLNQMTGLTARYHQAKTALASLQNMMELTPEHPQGKRFIHHKQFSGEIRFEQVRFQYPNQNGYAIDNIDLHVKPGEHIAIMGRMGSGKSTLEKMIMHLYQAQQGLITYDNIDAKQLDPVDIRHNIGYVPQEPLLFSGTLKDNIMLGRPWISDEALIKAAQIAGLEKLISRHPLGFNMPVGERGETFSGGQRQSITIARALLHNPSILLLDEPTSSMDVASETELIERLRTFVELKTLLLITHRSALLTLVDRIIVMDNGKIIMDGPKAEVLNRIVLPQSGQNRG